MFSQKRIRSLLATTLLFAIAALAPNAHATLILNWDLEQIADNSELTIIGTVEKTHAKWGGPDNKSIFTHTYIKVSKVVTGDASQLGKSIHVVRVGGTVDGITGYLAGAPQYQKGEKVLVFLGQNRDLDTGRQIGNEWLVTGLFLGKFRVETRDGKQVAVRNTNERGVGLVDPDGSVVKAKGHELAIPLDELKTRVQSVQKGVRR